MKRNQIEAECKNIINRIMDVDGLQNQCRFFSPPEGTVLRG